MSTADVTRDLVVAAANGLRVVDPGDDARAALDTTLRSIVARGIGVAAGEAIARVTAYPAAVGDDADGFVIDVSIRDSAGDSLRTRTIAAFVATDTASTLTGSVTLRATPVDSDSAPTILSTSALSGGVFVTAPVDTGDWGVLTVTASGATTGATTATTTQKVPDPKTKAQKKAAKNMYDRRIAAAKKAYAKALKKAGRSARKKKAAKTTYGKKRASARAAYAAATAGYRLVTVPAPGAESRPFALTISTDFLV